MGRKAKANAKGEFVPGVSPESAAARAVHALHQPVESAPGVDVDGAGKEAAKTAFVEHPLPMQERIERIAPAKLHPTRWNPREHINTETVKFQELLASVKGSGVREHLQVRPDPKKQGEYEILSGHRRALAATMAKVETVPAVVIEMNDEEAFDQVFFGNFGREDLTPAEEGRAVEILLEKTGGDKDTVAAKLGKSVQWVEIRARLTKLTQKWRAAAENPDAAVFGWSVGHLGLIARLAPAMQDALFSGDHQHELRHEGARWTVKQLDAWLNNTLLFRLASAPFSREDATLVKAAGACTVCPKRASCQGRLFIEEEDEATRKTNDRCLNPGCWQKKIEAWAKQRVEALKQEHGSAAVLLSTQYIGNYSREKDDLRKKFGGLELKDTDDVRPAKANEKGAVPGIVVYGKGFGELRWVMPQERSSYSSGGRREKKGPTPLAERRKILEAKRLSVVLKLLIAKLRRLSDMAEREKGEFKEITFGSLADAKTDRQHIIALAATFGTHRNNDSFRYGGDQPLDRVDGMGQTKEIDLWKRYGELAVGVDAGIEALWSCVVRVLARRLRSMDPITQTDPRYGKEAERIAKLCNVDLKPLRAEAEKVYPEPKGWINLQANGTAKKGK